jgi:hypothetical protein
VRAASNTFFRSGTPVKIALIWTKCRSVSAASSRAMVVLPTPGGPQRISDDRLPAASMTPSGAVGAQHLVLPDHLGQRARPWRSSRSTSSMIAIGAMSP